MPTIELKADCSKFEQQLAEFKSLLGEAGDLPEQILESLRALSDNIREEICLDGPVTTSGTGESVVFLRIREGGRFDACVAALRAFCDGRQI